jgi:hypothetical protein
MFHFDFGAPALDEIAISDFPSTPLRVTFIGVANVRGEGRQILINIMLPLVWKA